MEVYMKQGPEWWDKRELPWHALWLSKAFETDDVLLAIELIGFLLGKPLQEIFDVTEFDSQTGKPKRRGWIECAPWDGVLWISQDDFLYPCLKNNCALYRPILNRIPPNHILIVNDICVTHQKRSNFATASKLKFTKGNFEVV